MTGASDPPTEVDTRLDEAIFGLERAAPEMSAHTLLNRRQRAGLIVLVLVVAVGAVLRVRMTLIAFLVAVNIAYLLAVGFRVVLFVVGLRPGSAMTISDEQARAVPDADLPMYTILLPAFHEPGLVAELVRGVGRLDYPADRLEVLLLLEADDTHTIEAAAQAAQAHPGLFVVVLVPVAEPRTKPKACNYGLAQATGTFVSIYDAEDIPEALQLRRAVVAFEQLPPDVACLQARLAFYNDEQNLLTRWFEIEYLTWFANMLPGLAALGVPIPLGGTSNHLRTDVLRSVHGWDAFNVTEDADLGIRLARAGYRCGVLESETLEEANSDSINWTRQRSRWTKGYLQTAIVHLREPVRLTRQLGLRKTMAFVLTILGTPILALCNPIVWGLSLSWWFGTPTFVAELFPSWLYYPGVFSLFVGNFAIMYMGLTVVGTRGKRGLILPCVIVPIYWGYMAVGAVKALAQLIRAPSYWEKTAHGLDQHRR